ncbi:MAG: 50S ribosomal protein L1 [Patescibacteria group bacterium]|jgi:large subunit ribosomal protein L1
MGKTKTKVLGIDEVEQEQKEKAKKRNELKKQEKERESAKTVQKVEQAEEAVEAKTEKQEKKKNTGSTVRTHGKKYLKMTKTIDKTKKYSVKEAIALLKKGKFEAFDATVELHINVKEMGLKGEVTLPHGTGKEVRIAVFTSEVEAQLTAGVFDFDVLIARPSDMKSLVKFAKVLGPKGLMPSPKKGTLLDDVESARKKFAAGAVNFKSEPKFPIMHQVVGKISFTEAQLMENIEAFIAAVAPKNIDKAFVKTTMSPSVQLLILQE